ncbi:peptide chain release factor N(5)-glutamine methyltransferase [Mycoplasma sp. P36-A1]|uniref:peptide chain release factor N(5)-glutamine methyltransferase n=1 Tax=Mycoplasma sp. P36-A1 TaxID=3252900 RepID=UPI003C2B7DCF
MTIRELLNHGSKLAIDNNKEERAAYELLKVLTNLESYELYAKLDEQVANTIEVKFETMLKEYIYGTPLQHILGYETFFGRDLIVNEDVLIPRYETEELVENILYHIDDYFEDYETIKIGDVGSGSGAIAITLDLEEAKAKVYGSDISAKALVVAQANNDKFEADVTFMQGDLLQPFIDNNLKLDFFVSNPPYIPNQQEIQATVKDFEPNVALFGGNDGLDFYRRIFEDVDKITEEKAIMAFEFGYDQKEIMEEAIKHYFPNYEYEIIKDINGKDRMLFIYKNIKK